MFETSRGVSPSTDLGSTTFYQVKLLGISHGFSGIYLSLNSMQSSYSSSLQQVLNHQFNSNSTDGEFIIPPTATTMLTQSHMFLIKRMGQFNKTIPFGSPSAKCVVKHAIISVIAGNLSRKRSQTGALAVVYSWEMRCGNGEVRFYLLQLVFNLNASGNKWTV